MASVSGSVLSFFAPGLDSSAVNIVLNDGSGAVAIDGKFNIEVFTSATGAGPLGTGFQAAAQLQDATLLSNNTVQVGSPISVPEELLAGSYTVIDHTGNEDIRIIGSTVLPFSSITVVGSAGDTISGSGTASNSQLIDVSGTNSLTKAGAMTVVGGAGNTTVWAGSGGLIRAGGGKFEIDGVAGDDNSITGGAGSFTAFNFGNNNTVTGGSETTFIDDGYGAGGNNLLIGGSGALNFIKGDVGDTILGGTGLSLVIDGSAGDQSIRGGNGSSTYIAGGVGDTIIGGAANAIIIDGTPGDMTIIGGGIAALTGLPGDTFIFGGDNLSITGAAGDLNVAGNGLAGLGANLTVIGGAGDLFAFNLGTGSSVIGSSLGTSFINDAYGGGGASTLIGGAGGTTIIGGAGDSIVGGAGALEAWVNTGFVSQTIDLTSAGSADIVRDISAGGLGTTVTVFDFDTTLDRIASATDVDSSGGFAGISTAVAGNTLLVFTDGSEMTLIGVADPTLITFIQ